MGADFVCFTLDYPVGKNLKATKANRKTLLNDIKKRIAALDEDSLNTDDGWAETQEEWDEKLAEAFERVCDAVNDELRDSATLRIGDRCVVITGGMTWGDPPTDTFNAMALLADAGVL